MIVRKLLLLLLAVGFARPVSAEEPASIRRVAFVIGANDGGPGRVRLRFAQSDARSMANVLETLGGVAARDRFMLLNPTRAEVLDGLGRLSQSLGQKDSSVKRTELFVYYSGHSDEDGLMLGEERVEYGEFRHAIDALPADVRVVILDSCGSGAMTRAKGGVRRPPFMVDDATKVEGHAILTSSAANESAQESDRIGGSFFTHYLVSGLRGAADVTHDGRVTIFEAYQFAFNETLARTEQTSAGTQHPAYDIQLSGTGDLVMTDLRGSSARLVLPTEMDGRVFVRDPEGHLAAEMRKVGGRAVDLGLDPGTYTVTLVQGNGDLLGTEVTISDGRRSEIKLRQMEPLPTEVAVARGWPFADPASSGIAPYAHLPITGGVLPGTSTTNTVQARVLTNVSLNFPFGSVDRVDGAQLGILNRATEDVRGVQIGVAGSWISHNLYGVQLSGTFNVASNFEGLQAAFVLNQSATMHGTQVGLINIGGDVVGAQVGLINIASHVKGTQVGLINITDEIEGLPVGIFSYSRQGLLHLDLWASDSAPINIGVKAGGRMWYTLLALAPLNQGFFNCRNGYFDASPTPCRTNTEPFGSFGIGAKVPLGQFFLAADISGGPEFRTVSLGSVMVTQGSQRVAYERDFSGLFKSRIMFGWQPYKHFGIFAGIGANAYVTPWDPNQPPTPAGWGPHIFEEWTTRTLTIWPGGFIGIQI